MPEMMWAGRREAGRRGGTMKILLYITDAYGGFGMKTGEFLPRSSAPRMTEGMAGGIYELRFTMDEARTGSG